jgi:hypothetical protein
MKTALRVRELYCPAHFGNSYEVAGRNEMHAILSEAKHWGFNRYSDWFDTVDIRNPYAKHDGLFDLPEALWAQKFNNFATAASLGLELGLVVTPNHVFMDQVTPENEAMKLPGRIFGQLVCPSKPGVVDLILENYRRLFADFAARRLTLASISAGAYDYGGCDCPDCRPWIATFGCLTQRIVTLAREFFPRAAAELWGWWWSDDDHRDFTAWADREAPGFFTALAYHLPYGVTAYQKRPIPAGCKARAFVHIGYGETRGIDVYGHYGPAVAPRRLEQTAAFLDQEEADGFLAYSEGDCDDINKAIIAGLTSAQYGSADTVLRAYTARHFGGDEGAWSTWLSSMGDVQKVDPARTRKEFDQLAATAKPGWRLAALGEKLTMIEADAAVRAQPEWNDAKLRAARAFWDAKERLWRGVWKLGLGRHAFKFDWLAPDWHKEYTQRAGQRPAVGAAFAAKEA